MNNLNSYMLFYLKLSNLACNLLCEFHVSSYFKYVKNHLTHWKPTRNIA